MRRGLVAAVASLAFVTACASSGPSAVVEVTPRTEAKARVLAGVVGPQGWTAQDNKIRATDQRRFELGSVPLVIDTDGGVSVGWVSGELDEPKLYRTGCEAAADYLRRLQTTLASDTNGAAIDFDVDACVKSLTSPTTDDGRAITDTQTVAMWSGGATATDGNEYLFGLLRLGGAGDKPRSLNLVAGWRPKPA